MLCFLVVHLSIVIALVSVTHLAAQVLCGVQSLLDFLRGCQVYITGLGFFSHNQM